MAVVTGRVDDQCVDVLRVDHRRHLLRLHQRLLFEHGDVPASIADEDQQGPDGRIPQQLRLDHLVARHEAMRERRCPPHRQLLEPTPGERDARCGTQHHLGSAVLEDHDRDPVAAHVRVLQQRKDRSFCRGHPLLGVHRGRCIDDEHDEVAYLAFANLLAKVVTLQLEAFAGEPAAVLLHRGGRTYGGVDRQIGDLGLGLRSHVTAAPVGSLAGRAFAALLANPPLPGQVDAPQVEGLCRVGRRLVSA